jgi:hypothetical protein
MNVLKLNSKQARRATTWIAVRNVRQGIKQQTTQTKINVEQITNEPVTQPTKIIEHVIFMKEFFDRTAEEAKRLRQVYTGLENLTIA